VEVSSEKGGNEGVNHTEQYEFGELFGSTLETDDEDPVGEEGEGEDKRGGYRRWVLIPRGQLRTQILGIIANPGG